MFGCDQPNVESDVQYVRKTPAPPAPARGVISQSQFCHSGSIVLCCTDLVNVFTTFLPQLLLYPNPADPLNGEAAALMNKNKDEYARKVKEYVKQYASTNVKVKMEDEDDNTAMTTAAGSAAAAAAPKQSGAAVASAACASASAPKPVPKSSNDCKSSHDDDEDLGGSDEPEDVLRYVL